MHIKKSKSPTSINFYHKFMVNFSLSQYAYYLIIHILYYGFLGPLILVFITCKPSLRFICSNMLISRPSLSFYVQIFYWLCSLATYYAMYSKLEIGDLGLLQTLIVSIVLRSSTIAGKYATFQKEQIKKYNEVYITKAELDNELMMIDWVKQKSSIIFEEINNSILRKEIDSSTFKISFFVPLSEEIEQEVQSIIDSKEGFTGLDTMVQKRGETTNRYYDARIIFEYIVAQHNKQNPFKSWNMLFFGIISIVYGLLNGIIRVIYGRSFHGTTMKEKLIFYFIGLSNSFLIFTTVMFFDQANRDLKTKSFVLDQLGQMISARKIIEFSNTKILPTICLTDPISMRTWMNLRRLTLDYGLRFFYRHKIFFPVVLFVGMISLVMIFVTHVYWPSDKITELSYSFWMYHFLMLFMVFKLLFNSARVNSHFLSHRKALAHNSLLFSELDAFKEFYFKRKYDDLSGIVSSENSPLQKYPFDSKPQSFLHKRFIELIIEANFDELKKSKTRQEFYTSIAENMRQVEAMYENLSKTLDDEQEFYSLKILGWNVNQNGVINFAFALVSITVTAYEVFIKE